LYPTLLSLPCTNPKGATLLGWHVEGLFLQAAKWGAHAPVLIQSPLKGFASFEETYGAENPAAKEDWVTDSGDLLAS